LIGDEHALIGAKVAGRVKAVAVDLGSSVEQGQVIAELETDVFDLRVQQAEAQVGQARAALGITGNEKEDTLDPTKAAPVLQEKAVLDEAKRNLNRRRALSSKRVITTEELQQAESLVQVAEAKYDSSLNLVYENLALLAVRKAELATARQARLDATLKAPFSGVIEARQVAPGSYVNVGDPVATLVRTNPLRFHAAIPERSSTKMRVGQSVRVFVEGESSVVDAQISRISPSLDLASRSLVIEADIDNRAGRFRTGLFAEGEIVVEENDKVLAVPQASIQSFAGVQKVWVVRQSKAQAHRIRTGRTSGDFVEVVEGLQPGDVLIADGQQGCDGDVQVASAPVPESPSVVGK
jgi:HlyD family secretion protein